MIYLKDLENNPLKLDHPTSTSLLRTFQRIFIAICIFGTSLQAEDRLLRVYRCEKAPILDGKMDEACWQKAEIAQDFRIFQQAQVGAKNKTRVRVTYDTQNLYLFYELFDTDMPKLRYGPPEDDRDVLKFSTTDVAEFFIDPGLSRYHYFQLAASPLGTRHDYSRKLKSHFNPDWKAVPTIHEDRWCLEIAIPFAEMAHQGETLSTPQKNEIWGMQFCREEPRHNHLTQWQPTPRSFHQVKNFGKVVFMGLPQRELPRITKKGHGEIGYGKNTYNIDVDSKDILEYRHILSRNQHKYRDVRGVFTIHLDLEFQIEEGGLWQSEIQILKAGRMIYQSVAKSRLSSLQSDCRIALDQVEKGYRAIKTLVRDQSLESKLLSLKGRLASMLKKFKDPETLSKADWKNLETDMLNIKKDWDKDKLRCHAYHLAAKSGSKASFLVGHKASTEKIYRDLAFDGKLDSSIKLSGAGGESESFQLAVIPVSHDLVNAEVRFSDLKSPQGMIDKTRLRHFLVEEVHIDRKNPMTKHAKSHEPDILRKGATISVMRGKTQGIWIDVEIPRDSRAGIYQGSVFVQSGSQVVEKKITLEVYDFNLPKIGSLENNMWFSPGYSWAKFYGEYNKDTYSLARYEKDAQTLSRYRIGCFADDWLTMRHKFKIIKEKDGSYSFDFSGIKPFIEIGKKYGATAYRASHGCNLGALSPLTNNLRQQFINRYDDKPYIHMGEDLIAWREKRAKGEVGFEAHPVYPSYLKAWVKFLKEMKVLKSAHFELFDEPNSNPRWLQMLRHHRFLKEHVPELQLISFGVDPLQVKAGRSAIGLIDLWAPGLKFINDKMLITMKKRRNEKGEKFWFYTCGSSKTKEGYTPFVYYDEHLMGSRMHAWFAWKMKADGMLIFAMSGVPKANIKKDASKRWPQSPWKAGSSRGCGTLVYPGPDGQVLPSMRLANIRDGLEDYEYFHLLRRILDESKNLPSKLVGEIRAALEIDKHIIHDSHRWTKTKTNLDQKRQQIAMLIHKAIRAKRIEKKS